jgi:hypothetical protein
MEGSGLEGSSHGACRLGKKLSFFPLPLEGPEPNWEAG